MLTDRMLAPFDPGFSAVEWLKQRGSPRLHDLPELGAWIDQAARESNINQRWLIALAQKEQSAITLKTLSSRGFKWLMGYGATDGGDIEKYAGPRIQVFAAAMGLRGYLEPGGHYAPGMVGRPFCVDEGRASYTPETVAEAASLLYTPWISGLRLMEECYETFFGRTEATEIMARQADVAAIAEQVLRRARAGERVFSIEGVPFEAADRAYCSEFVRECHAVVTGVLWPGWAGRFATWTERGLQQAGYKLAEPVRGCIVAFNQDVYNKWGTTAVWNASRAWVEERKAYGHVAIYIGDGQVIENSSGFGSRSLDQVGKHRISGFYAPLAINEPEQREELVVLMDPATEYGRTFEVMVHEDGRRFVPAREVFETLGYEVSGEHLAEKQRIYVKPSAATVEVAERIAAGKG